VSAKEGVGSSTGATRKRVRLRGILLDGWPIVFPLAVCLIVGFWPQEVLSGRFPHHLPPYPVAWLATLFWVVLVVGIPVTYVYLVRARVQADASAADAARLSGQVTDLTAQVSALTTQAASATKAQKVSDLAANVMQQVFRDYNELRGQPEVALRRILWWFAVLAWTIDEQPEHVRYAANVMWFEPWSSAQPRTRDLLMFSDYPDDDLEGLLVLSPKFSTTRTKKAAIDDQIRAMALAVPTQAAIQRDGRGRILPGAPRAFFERTGAEVYSDARHMLGELKEGGFSERVTSELQAYLESAQGRLVRSLISVVLIPADGHRPSGVLNIHRNSPGILAGSEVPFVNATVPMRTLLSHALALAVKRG
jgi:hypothetical protein